MHPTIYAQYSNSPTIVQMVDDYYSQVEKAALFKEFENYVYNVDTSVGFGLDIWGRIVVISRQLEVTGIEKKFGFDDGATNDDAEPYNQGVYYVGNDNESGTYTLTDDAYRVLVMAKAAANIAATTARGINSILQAMFPNRGRAYVIDTGAMTMSIVFAFFLTEIERAILFQSGVLPRPAGVGVNYVYEINGEYLGFSQAGYNGINEAFPFNEGVFFHSQDIITK